MALAQSVTQLASTLIGILRSRLELASMDVEDELRAMINVALAGTVAVILGTFALLFAALAMVATYWETRRVEVLLLIAAVFLVLASGIAFSVWRFFERKPLFMAATLAELDKDRKRMSTSS
jgi:uncharacterized membrane protein YqjE